MSRIELETSSLPRTRSAN